MPRKFLLCYQDKDPAHKHYKKESFIILFEHLN